MPLLGRDVDEHRASAPCLRLQAAIGKLLLDLIRIGFRLIDLVHRHDDRHIRRLRVVDRLQRLRHHAVIRRHHDHDDVGDLRAACTHAGKGLVTRRIEEHDLAPKRRRIRLGDVNLVRTDVLRDATGFARRHIRRADRVQQRGLTVVDVTHDRDHRRAVDLDHSGRIFEEAFDGLVLQLLFDRDDLGVRTELARDLLHQLAVERLVHRDEDTLHQQHRDQVLAAYIQLLGQILDADAFRHRDRLGDRQRLARDLLAAVTRWRLEALHRAFLALLVALSAATLSRTRRRTHAARRLVPVPAVRQELRPDARQSQAVRQRQDAVRPA